MVIIMKANIGRILRMLCMLMALCLLTGATVACASTSEVPDGYQYATCTGEYFRLFVPTQWTVNTESGVSSAFLALSTGNVTVTMTQVATETIEKTDETAEIPSLSDFVAAHLADIGEMKDFKQEKSFDSTLSGYVAKDITYTASVLGTSHRFRQILTRVEGRFYLFTYSTVAEQFDQWLNSVDEILENITFESYPYEGEDGRKIPDNVEAPEGMKLISDNEVAYRFFAPESWIRDVNNGQNLVYASEEDRSNVSVVAYDMEDYSTYTVETYWTECKNRYTATLEEFTILSETETTLDGGERQAMVYEYTYTLGGVQYQVRQTVCMVGMIYTMTYTALPENYDAHMEDVLAMEQALHFRGFGE